MENEIEMAAVRDAALENLSLDLISGDESALELLCAHVGRDLTRAEAEELVDAIQQRFNT